MTQIKKITNKQGNDIYLRTHTKAVVDDNGYTAESRLQAMQDEINQAQLEIGAVPSDLAPTDGSTNWVTSGGVYNGVPTNMTSANNSDLDIADEDMNTLVRFENGHIETKSFNSKDAALSYSQTSNYDLSISDDDGYILAILKNGHIKTKYFDSENFKTLESLVNKYKGKRISILGDSISTYGVPSATNQLGTYCYSYYPTATCRYSQDGVDSIAFNVNDTYWMQLINKLDANLGINESWRGSCVTGDSADCFCSQNRINHLGSNGTPDLILVFGGTNDAGTSKPIGTFNGGNYSDFDTDVEISALDVSTFANAYKAMIIRLMKTYPSAEIVSILPTYTSTYYTINDLDSYVEVIKEVCDYFGVKWIDTRISGINIFNKNTYLVDGIHPNKYGMELLANLIYKHLIYK